MAWLKRWGPALAWALAISGFSTGAFSSDHTSRVIIPFLHWLMPQASNDSLEFIHHIIRKCGHFSEYCLFSLLLLHGIRAGREGLRLSWMLTAVLIVAAYASLDEFHQMFVPGRTAKVTDVLIDTCGGIAGMIFASLYIRWREARGKRIAAAVS